MNKQLTCAGSYYAPCVWFYLFRKGISQADTAAAARQKRPCCGEGRRPATARRQTNPDGRPAFERLPRGVSRNSECGRGQARKDRGASKARVRLPRQRGAVKPGRRKAGRKARPFIRRPPPLPGCVTGRRYLIGEGVPQAGAYEALPAKRACVARSPFPRSPPKRGERSPLQTSRRNLPVTLSAQRATSDGVPAATIRPPALPPPGPISRM